MRRPFVLVVLSFLLLFPLSTKAESDAQIEARILAERRMLLANKVWGLSMLIAADYNLYFEQESKNSGGDLVNSMYVELHKAIQFYQKVVGGTAKYEAISTDAALNLYQTEERVYLSERARLPLEKEEDKAYLRGMLDQLKNTIYELQDLQEYMAGFNGYFDPNAKAINLPQQFYSQPLDLNYLGDERYTYHLESNPEDQRGLLAHALLAANALWMRNLTLSSVVSTDSSVAIQASQKLVEKVSFLYITWAYRSLYERGNIKRNFSEDFSNYYSQAKDAFLEVHKAEVALTNPLMADNSKLVSDAATQAIFMFHTLNGIMHRMENTEVFPSRKYGATITSSAYVSDLKTYEEWKLKIGTYRIANAQLNQQKFAYQQNPQNYTPQPVENYRSANPQPTQVVPFRPGSPVDQSRSGDSSLDGPNFPSQTAPPSQSDVEVEQTETPSGSSPMASESPSEELPLPSE